MLSGCTVSSLAARFAFFPPEPATYAVRKDEACGGGGRLVASGVPRNPAARLTVLYSHGNAADLGQLYDLFVQLKVNLKVNLMGLVVPLSCCFLGHLSIYLYYSTSIFSCCLFLYLCTLLVKSNAYLIA